MEELGKTSNKEVSVRLPFLGTLRGGEPFEYLLWTIHSDFLEIAIFDWLVNRIQLHVGDKVNLYLPQYLSEDYRFTTRVADTVVSMHPNEEMQGKIYRISVSNEDTQQGIKDYNLDEYIQQLPVKISLIDLLIALIKDSMILKQGIKLYIKHLVPYFSRIVTYSHAEYIDLKEHFFYDVEKHIKDNENKLQKLYQLAKEKIVKSEEIPVYINLEDLREIIESEISFSLFIAVFSDQKILNINEHFRTQITYGFAMYTNAIKNLEKRLYSNYNHIVAIYLKSLR